MAMQFTDSIEETVEVLRELLAGIPPASRERAKHAASAVEKMVVRLQADHPKDPAVALGVAFALFVIAQYFIQAERGGEGKSMIQLLS